jgi:chromosome segregation ATPase
MAEPDTKEPEFLEVKVPKAEMSKVAGHQMSPDRMRRFITHLSLATSRAETKMQQKGEVKDKLERIKQLSLNKRSTKNEIETELGSFEDLVKEIIKDEEKILEEQRKETQQVNQLKGMIETLSKKLIEVGQEYSAELEHKDGKILDLREALASANIKMSETGDERQKKIDRIERHVKAKADNKPSHEDVESHLSLLEDRHDELTKSGKHPKKELDRLKRVIDTHKEALSNV